MLKLLRNLTISWGIFTCSQKQALHFCSEIRAATQWLLGEQEQALLAQPLLSEGHPPSSSSHTSPVFPMKRYFSSFSLRSKIPQGEAPTAGAQHINSCSQDAARFSLAGKKAQINFLPVSGSSLPAPPSKIQVRIPD